MPEDTKPTITLAAQCRRVWEETDLKAEEKILDDARAREASDLLLWLNNNECLSTNYGTMDKALAAIEAGKHRR